ncbi:hypothetical protein ACH5RR_018357 [Cinchona calisaya]|uniref:Uncharacterized protein n=1 Tax=Cinchona calisaya TaxID=153742 RepID=A0ABD2ZMI0_9GENT
MVVALPMNFMLDRDQPYFEGEQEESDSLAVAKILFAEKEKEVEVSTSIGIDEFEDRDARIGLAQVVVILKDMVDSRTCSKQDNMSNSKDTLPTNDKKLIHLKSNKGKASLEDKESVEIAANEELPANSVEIKSLDVSEGQHEKSKDELDLVTNTFMEKLLSCFLELDYPDTINKEPLSLQE